MKKQINIFNKFNFAIHTLCGKMGMRVTSEFTEITDGFCLFRMPIPELVEGDLPIGIDENELVKEKMDFIILPNTAKDIEKNIPQSQTMPVLENGWIVKSEKEKTVTFKMTNFDTEKKISVNPRDGRWPNTESIWPKDEPVAEVVFNIDFMIKLCQQFSKSDDRRSKTVRLKIYGKEKPIMLESTKDEGQKPKALLMPCKD